MVSLFHQKHRPDREMKKQEDRREGNRDEKSFEKKGKIKWETTKTEGFYLARG